VDADTSIDTPDGARTSARRRANGWPVLPLRVFLAAVFLFAGYAKLAYPRFFDPNSIGGFKSAVDAAKTGTPIGGILGPLSEHPGLFGHITAFAEIAIGLGLLVGLLTRLAALGGMVLMASIVLSIDWGGVKEYTGSSGWFTSVDLAVGAALSVYLIGGADPFSLDAVFWRARQRRRARDDSEPGFRHNELAESRARLQGDPRTDQPTQQVEREPADGSLWNSGYSDRPADTERFEPVRAEERLGDR
jgi:thiosulfate dehydrogenase [quinone] large subunit